MKIFVFEADSNDKYNDIIIDWLKLSNNKIPLSCDWRLPNRGKLIVPHPQPSHDNTRLEINYTLDTIKIPNYIPGMLTQPSEQIQKDLENLPPTVDIQITKNIKITCIKNNIVDMLYCSVLGELYLYEAQYLVIH